MASIANGESGSSVRTKLNTALGQLFVCSRKLGWASGYAPPNSSTIYFGDSPTGVPNATATNRQFRLQTGVIKTADFSVSATGVGSNEAITFNLRNITDATSTLIYASLNITTTTKGFVATGLSIATDETKEYSIEMVTPAFGSPHAGVALSMTLNIFVA